MHIVIDIPEDFYEALKKADEMTSGLRSENTLMSVVYSAVAKGTPLPKEHGDLQVKKAINVLIDVQSQFQASLDEVDVDKDCKEAEEDNRGVVNALEMAIRALEEQPVLDKIRAEIETIIGEHNWDDYDFCSGLIRARKIIDKYKDRKERGYDRERQ